jgi:hypothetical protein
MSTLQGNQIQLFQLRMAISGLNLNIKTNGRMQLTRGFNAHKWLKNNLSISGNKESVLKQSMEIYMERVNETGDFKLIEEANKMAMGV